MKLGKQRKGQISIATVTAHCICHPIKCDEQTSDKHKPRIEVIERKSKKKNRQQQELFIKLTSELYQPNLYGAQLVLTNVK